MAYVPPTSRQGCPDAAAPHVDGQMPPGTVRGGAVGAQKPHGADDPDRTTTGQARRYAEAIVLARRQEDIAAITRQLLLAKDMHALAQGLLPRR